MDIFQDIVSSISALERRVETQRFGPFVFQIGLDDASLRPLATRLDDALARFAKTPLAMIASQLEQEVTVQSIHGTNSIEGGTLTEDETADVLTSVPSMVVSEAERQRAVNLRDAYVLAQQAAAKGKGTISLELIQQLHVSVTRDLSHEYNRPGLWRDNPDAVVTYVGNAAHGGRYKPPQHGPDIKALMRSLVDWDNAMLAQGVSALIRAPLVHLYFELIHPFWDGNGRVGRILEMLILLGAGYHYVPVAMPRFYFQAIDRYFASFNQCRKEAAKGLSHANTAFVQLFLEGMLASCQRLHDRANQLIGKELLVARIQRLYQEGALNQRQYVIVTQLLDAKDAVTLAKLKSMPWYAVIYAKLSEKTRSRDLKRLEELGLLSAKNGNLLLIGQEDPDYEV